MDKFKTTQIGLAKFNSKTLKENRNWKTKKNWIGASYGFQYYIPEKIPYHSYLYIIEMNNDTNKIVGIGFIRNQRRTEWRSKIYNDCQDYNRFIIKSKYHRNRDFLIKKNPDIIKFLERILFKGAGHLKRSSCFSLTLNKIATAPPINKITLPKKKVYLCSVCGKPKKDHVCSGVRVQVKKFCNICGKVKYKGNSKKHVCSDHQNTDNVTQVLSFLKDLFISESTMPITS